MELTGFLVPWIPFWILTATCGNVGGVTPDPNAAAAQTLLPSDITLRTGVTRPTTADISPSVERTSPTIFTRETRATESSSHPRSTLSEESTSVSTNDASDLSSTTPTVVPTELSTRSTEESTVESTPDSQSTRSGHWTASRSDVSGSNAVGAAGFSTVESTTVTSAVTTVVASPGTTSPADVRSPAGQFVPG